MGNEFWLRNLLALFVVLFMVVRLSSGDERPDYDEKWHSHVACLACTGIIVLLLVLPDIPAARTKRPYKYERHPVETVYDGQGGEMITDKLHGAPSHPPLPRIAPDDQEKQS